MGAFQQWAIRCTPGLSTVAFIALSVVSLADLSPIWRVFGCSLSSTSSNPSEPAQPSTLMLVWIVYALFVHLVTFAFPLRLCRATWQLSERIEEAHAKLARDVPLERGRPRIRYASSNSDGSEASFSPDSPTTPVEKGAQFIINCNDVYDPLHVIMIPCYKEDLENIRFTLKILASHDNAPSYDIFLAMEQRDPNAVSTAECMLQYFAGRFRDIQYTMHPGGLPGEAAGKSSNIAWCARQAQFKYKGSEHWKDALMTVMDSDTHLSSDYFKLVESKHRLSREANDYNVMYMPPVVFDRNALHVPLLVRIADMMWSAACLSMCGNNSVISIPTAVYTLPIDLVARVGGWDTGPEAIGEDLHMMLKCYFNTNARLSVFVIPSPASQCNVSSDMPGIRGWVAGVRARYFQGLRHMWGCLDTGFGINQFKDMRRRGDEDVVPAYEGDDYLENSTRSSSLRSSASSETLVSTDINTSGSATPVDRQASHRSNISRWYRTLNVFCRLYEAHMIPAHMAVVLIASAVYGNCVPPERQPDIMAVALFVTGASRALSFAIMVFYFVVFYDRYHRLAVERREAEMKRVKLYDELDPLTDFCHRRISDWQCWADCLLFAIGGFIYGSLPAMHAVVAHFFTNRLDYVVSAKPKQKALEEDPEKKV